MTKQDQGKTRTKMQTKGITLQPSFSKEYLITNVAAIICALYIKTFIVA